MAMQFAIFVFCVEINYMLGIIVYDTLFLFKIITVYGTIKVGLNYILIVIK